MKRPIYGGLVVKAFDVMKRAVEEGVQSGWYRAHKHHDEPDEKILLEDICEEVMNSICEWFDFPELE